jgi:hypothetical protein
MMMMIIIITLKLSLYISTTFEDLSLNSAVNGDEWSGSRSDSFNSSVTDYWLW